MDPHRKRAMRIAHTNHVHTCPCGKSARGNGGWASHRWACPIYQARLEAWIEERGYCPYDDRNVRRAPKWRHDGTSWVEA